ncbi:MAG: hypothetical protein OXG67_01575 [bacterium]|nr:hypothetical protein [bacterium]
MPSAILDPGGVVALDSMPVAVVGQGRSARRERRGADAVGQADPGGVVALDSISPAWRWIRSPVLWWTPGALWWAKPNP